MKKLFIALCLILALSTSAKAEFFSDVILTGTQGIWVDARSYSSLGAAITAIGANDREIVVVSPQVVTTLTVPSNVRLRFLRDGSITNSDQLTINTKNISADNRQIFTGVGNIDFAAGTVLRTAWFSNIETAFALTVNDTVTLIVSKATNVTASYSPGNNVTLKWEAAGNILTANVGVTISNIGQIEAGNYQILAGAGNFRFRDGPELNLTWFPTLRAAITWINTNKATLVANASHPVDFSDSIPSNINVQIRIGGELSVSPGITLTIANAKQIDIGPYYFDPFAGTGSVAITGGLTYTPATTLTAAVLNSFFAGSGFASAAEITIGTESNKVIAPDQLYLTNYEIDALKYGSGTSFTQATIQSALTAIGTSNKVTLLIRPGTWPIISNADWSAYTNVTFKIVPGAVFSGAFAITFPAGTVLPSAAFSDLSAAKVLIGTSNVTLEINKSETISADLTLVATTSIRPIKGNILTIATTKTLTLNGPFEAGLYQVFNCLGTGKVTFGARSITVGYPEWFGDCTVDASTAIQALLDKSNITFVSFAQGTYTVGTTIQIDRAVHIKGAGKVLTTLQASGAGIGSVISVGVLSTTNVDFVTIDDLTIHANGSSYCLYGYMPHAIISRIYARGASIAGIALEGWCVRISESIVGYNTGDGIRTIGLGGYSHALVISQCVIFLNSGWGFFAVEAGGQVSFLDNAWEENKKGAIYAWGEAVTLGGANHFEDNAEVGWDFTSPVALNIKANIIANGSSVSTTIGYAYPAKVVVNNTQSSNTYATYLVYAIGPELLEMSGNYCGSGTVALLGMYGGTSTYGDPRNITIGQNFGFSSLVSLNTITGEVINYNYLSSIYIAKSLQRNIAVTALSTWTKVVDTGAASTYQVSAVTFPEDPNVTVYEIIDADSAGSDYYGFTINAANYPSLHGKYVVWSCHVKATAPATSVYLRTRGVNDGGTLAAAGWKVVSRLFLFPATGTLVFGFWKLGAGGSVQVATPVLTELGGSIKEQMDRVK
uniref:Putative pectate lyase n=1 Tax=viral metagenome TaxID=1070528 RepID=A0A6M3K498_9ZZZZ